MLSAAPHLQVDDPADATLFGTPSGSAVFTHNIRHFGPRVLEDLVLSVACYLVSLIYYCNLTLNIISHPCCYYN